SRTRRPAGPRRTPRGRQGAGTCRGWRSRAPHARNRPARLSRHDLDEVHPAEVGVGMHAHPLVDLELVLVDRADLPDRYPAREERLQLAGLEARRDDHLALADVAALRDEVEDQVLATDLRLDDAGDALGHDLGRDG